MNNQLLLFRITIFANTNLLFLKEKIKNKILLEYKLKKHIEKCEVIKVRPNKKINYKGSEKKASKIHFKKKASLIQRE